LAAIQQLRLPSPTTFYPIYCSNLDFPFSALNRLDFTVREQFCKAKAPRARLQKRSLDGPANLSHCFSRCLVLGRMKNFRLPPDSPFRESVWRELPE
jgi:hypothetical protein